MFYFCGLGLNLKLLKFSFYSTYKQYKLFWYFFLFKILKTQYWDFHSAEYFFAFSHSFKYQKFFAAKTLTQMSHLFCSRIGSYRLLLQMDYWIRCPPWLLLGLDLMLLSFDWLNSSLFLIGNRISHLSHDWRPSSCLLCLSTTGFCFIILQRRSRSVHSWNGIIFAYDALVVVLLLLVWLVMSSTFFFFFLYIIGVPRRLYFPALQ